MEVGLASAIKWASGRRAPWKLILVVREIQDLCLVLDASFKHTRQSAKRVTDFLAKIGVDRK